MQVTVMDEHYNDSMTVTSIYFLNVEVNSFFIVSYGINFKVLRNIVITRFMSTPILIVSKWYILLLKFCVHLSN